jgi:hypothetical protein
MLGPLERSNINHQPNRGGVSLPSPEDGNRYPFRNAVSCHLEFRTMDFSLYVYRHDLMCCDVYELSARANYTDRATAKLVPTFAGRGCQRDGSLRRYSRLSRIFWNQLDLHYYDSRISSIRSEFALEVKSSLCLGTAPSRRCGSDFIDPRFLDMDTGWRWVVSFRLLPLYSGTHWTGGCLDDTK